MKHIIKYLSILLIIIICSTACENEERIGDGSFHKNFISGYYEGKLSLVMMQPNNSTILPNAGFILTEPEAMCYYPGNPAYERLAARNGDTDFNQTLWCGAQRPYVFAENFAQMHVVSNADWDAAHPAGTLLDDILLIRMYSCAKFIHSGYNMGKYEDQFLQNLDYLNEIKKLLSELTSDDMKMITLFVDDLSPTTKSPVIIFTSAPTLAKEHTLTLRWTTVEGDVKTASITCTPEVDPTLQ